LSVVAAALLAPLPQTVLAQSGGWQETQGSALQREIADRIGKELRPFYGARDYQPLWLNEFGRPSGAASMLMHHLRTAQLDGVSAKKIGFSKIAKSVDRARRGDRDDIAKAEVQLSEAFAEYIRAMRAADRYGMIYE